MKKYLIMSTFHHNLMLRFKNLNKSIRKRKRMDNSRFIRLNNVTTLLILMGGVMFLGCGTNSDKQETKSQNIIITKEIIEEKDTQSLSLLQVTVSDNEKAQEIASMYESIDVCTNSNCFRTDIISDPKDTTIADIAISDFSEPLKYISYKKYNESLYDAHFYYLPKEINITIYYPKNSTPSLDPRSKKLLSFGTDFILSSFKYPSICVIPSFFNFS